jgi:hypothetical protein
MEHLAAGMERGCEDIPSRTHSVVKWSQICHCSARKLRSFAQRSTELSLISSRSVADLQQFSSRSPADRLQIDCAKLLEIRDESSKKSGTSPDQIRVDKRRVDKIETPANGSFAKSEEVRKNAVAQILAKDLKPLVEKLTVEELETAWERHRKYRGTQPMNTVFGMFVSRMHDGKLDVNRFRARHRGYCEAWDAKGWQYCPLSLWDWIEAGMPEPAPHVDQQQAGKKKSFEESVESVLQERFRRGERLL